MPSLYTRATPFQRRLLRLVEGQIRSAGNDHNQAMPDTQVRGIAKRIVGELSETWDKLDALRATFQVRSDAAVGATVRVPGADAGGVPAYSASPGDAVLWIGAASPPRGARPMPAPPGLVRYIFRRNDQWCSRVTDIPPFGSEFWQPANEPHETREWGP